MSAAPVIPLSEVPAPHSAKIPKGKFVPTRPATLLAFAQMSRCEIGIQCLVHSESTGWGRDWTRTPIKISTFATHCNQDERTVQKTITKNESDGSLRRKKVPGGYIYSRPRPIDIDSDQEIWGDCATCKEPSIYVVDRSVPIPHTLFLDVFRGVDDGVFLVALIISLRTLRGKKDGQLWVYPDQISIADFRASNREKSEIEADLKEGERLGLFRSAGKRGGIQTYWVTPENWPTVAVRPKRVGGNPSPIRRKRETVIQEPQQPKQQDTTKPSPPEFLSKPCGVCIKCGTWAVIDVVPAPKTPLKKPLGRSREGPENLMAPGKPYVAPWKIEKQSKKA